MAKNVYKSFCLCLTVSWEREPVISRAIAEKYEVSSVFKCKSILLDILGFKLGLGQGDSDRAEILVLFVGKYYGKSGSIYICVYNYDSRLIVIVYALLSRTR